MGERRIGLLAAAVDYVLDHGITGLSLRPLAATLGTSDRMLIYYFTTRDDLIRAVLDEIAHRLRTLFADVLPPGQQPPATIVGSALSAGLHDPDVRRLLAVWLEVVALAARGDAVFSSTARAVVEDWVAWVGERIDVPDEQRRSAAAGVLVIVDGLVLFGAAGADEEGAAGAAWLLDSLTSTGPA